MTDLSHRAFGRPAARALAAALAASLAPQAIAAPPALATPAPASAPSGTLPFAEVLVERLRQNIHRETYIAQILAPLRQLDTNGDGLDQRDAAREETIARTRARAQLAEQLLSMDYNGDLKVERAEILDFLDGDAQRRAAAADALFQRFDTNRDGAATIAEALATAAQSRRSEGSGMNVAALLALDPNGDGRLTARELEALAIAVFDYFDTDRDGTLSAAEASAIRAEQRLVREVREKREAGCSFTPPSAAAHFIAYAPYGGQTISTAYVGSPDIETGVIDVTIAPGTQPLYLVLKTYDAVIWRFSGATERIERVVAASFKTGRQDDRDARRTSSAAGVIGVPRAKVQIAGPDCLPRLEDQREIDAGVPQETLTAMFTRKPDAIRADNPIGKLALPALAMTRFEHDNKPAVLPGFDPVIWQDALGFSAGGLATIKPGEVVAAEPVGDYDVLPNKFGLAQLVASGHLTYEGTSFFARKFTLQKPIARWPAEMNGALSAAFIKPDNIPMPQGRLGHSCLLTVEQGAKANWERVCREAPGIQTIPEPVRPSDDRLKR